MVMKRKKTTNGNVHPDDEPKLPVPIRRPREQQEEPRAREPEPDHPRMRNATVHRRTKETDVHVAVELDGSGRSEVETGIAFFDHMLVAFARHSMIDLKVVARGDLQVDYHHTVEDVGLCIGRAILDAMGDRKGIFRFGEATVPMDEALIRCAVDYSGRPALVYRVAVPAGRIGSFDVELAEVFFGAFANEARMNLHLNLEYGANRHHIVEGCFKALARATANALAINPRQQFEVPSTKGTLD